MTREELKTLLDRLEAPVLPPKLQAAKVRYRFRLDRGESLDLVLERGRLRLVDGQEPPDCVLECTPDESVAVLTGRHNLLTAFMRGDLRLQGTLSAGKSLYTFLKYAQFEEAQV